MIKTIVMKKVDRVPEILDEGVLYVSRERQLAMHLCCCGCKSEVTTPLKGVPSWVLTTNHGRPTLSPSIGNSGLPCRSHYFIRDGKVLWCSKMSNTEIHQTQSAEERERDEYFELHNAFQQKNGRLHQCCCFIQKLFRHR